MPMRTIRPAVVLGVIATALVLWFMTRMWFGDLTLVWKISGILGAWSPIVAASLYLYVQHVGGQEHKIFVAWLTRAIGMHVVLLWMLGVNDWLAGPLPLRATAHRWDPDAGAPVVLILFFPVFFLTVAFLKSVLRANETLTHHYKLPTLPHERDRTIPNRGVSYQSNSRRRNPVLWVPTILGLAGCAATLVVPASSELILAAVGIAAILHTIVRPVQLMSYIITMGCMVLFSTIAALRTHSFDTMPTLAIAPWVLLATAVLLAQIVRIATRDQRKSSHALA